MNLIIQEKDALEHIQGTGFYKYYQRSTTFPNYFDTRQIFLIKIHYPEIRWKFPETYNTRNNSLLD